MAVSATTQSAALYIKIKQIRPARQLKGRFATNTIPSHRRPPPEVVTHPELLPIPDPSNTQSSEDLIPDEIVQISGDS